MIEVSIKIVTPKGTSIEVKQEMTSTGVQALRQVSGRALYIAEAALVEAHQ